MDMSRHSMMGLALLVVMATAAALLSPAVARADDRAAETALKTLYQKTPEAKTLEDSAKGILVFPNIKKAGFIARLEDHEDQPLAVHPNARRSPKPGRLRREYAMLCRPPC